MIPYMENPKDATRKSLVLINEFDKVAGDKDTEICCISIHQPKQHVKKQRHYFANKGLSIQSFGFSSSHVWM